MRHEKSMEASVKEANNGESEKGEMEKDILVNALSLSSLQRRSC